MYNPKDSLHQEAWDLCFTKVGAVLPACLKTGLLGVFVLAVGVFTVSWLVAFHFSSCVFSHAWYLQWCLMGLFSKVDKLFWLFVCWLVNMSLNCEVNGFKLVSLLYQLLMGHFTSHVDTHYRDASTPNHWTAVSDDLSILRPSCHETNAEMVLSYPPGDPTHAVILFTVIRTTLYLGPLWLLSFFASGDVWKSSKCIAGLWFDTRGVMKWSA